MPIYQQQFTGNIESAGPSSDGNAAVDNPFAELVEDMHACFFTDSGSRSIPSKYIYDEKGSILFEKICETPEYYLTRTEEKLLIDQSEEIIKISRPDEIMELGSGSSVKTRHILNACEKLDHTCRYAPIDISESMLLDSCEKLREDYGWLQIRPIIGDYTTGLQQTQTAPGSRLVVFLGSTIGNMELHESRSLLKEVRSMMKEDDFFLVGLDRLKDKNTLHAAYDDKAGYSAGIRFNLLKFLNRELGADFNPDDFRYEVSFDDEKNRIDMWLVSDKEQRVRFGQLGNTDVVLKRGESIHTGFSRKFNDRTMAILMNDNGFRIHKHYQPDNSYFSLLLTTPS